MGGDSLTGEKYRQVHVALALAPGQHCLGPGSPCVMLWCWVRDLLSFLFLGCSAYCMLLKAAGMRTPTSGNTVVGVPTLSPGLPASERQDGSGGSCGH